MFFHEEEREGRSRPRANPTPRPFVLSLEKKLDRALGFAPAIPRFQFFEKNFLIEEGCHKVIKINIYGRIIGKR